jgi:hypothetical protein
MTLTQLLTKTRRPLDESDEVFWDDDELIDYVNEGYFYYWNWLIQAQHALCVTSDTLDMVSGVATCALPSDCVSCKLVERVVGAATIPMEYFVRYETSNRTQGVAASSLIGYLPRYHFEGANLILEPTPSIDEDDGIKVTYYKQPTRLADGSDEPLPPLDDFYSDLLVIYAVICAKEKEEMISPGTGGIDTAPFLGRQQRLEQKFKEMIELPTEARIYVEPFGIETC